jgi:hypothetical protein
MVDESRAETGSIAPQAPNPGEASMVRRQLWEEIRRQHQREGTPIAELARAFGLDRKTVRRFLLPVLGAVGDLGLVSPVFHPLLKEGGADQRGGQFL